MPIERPNPAAATETTEPGRAARAVLVVDDQPNARELLGTELQAAGFDVTAAADGEAAWERFCERPPDIVITDLAMPRCDGLELLHRIRTDSDVPVIVFSGHGSIESAATAIKAGADEFVDSLSCDVEDLVRLVRQAAESSHTPPAPLDLERRIVGTSAAIGRVRWQITGLAPLATPVLVSGEVGTGRSTAIRALHELGATGSAGLCVLDASQFSPEDDPRRGEGPGAVHIRNVEQLSAAGQAFWADQLAQAETPSLRGHARIFASATAPLSPLVRDGSFHPALGRALLRFHIELPPLRARSEDIPPIARSLLQRIGSAVGRSGVQLSPAAAKHLQASRLPENIRQLERLLERAVAYSVGRTIRRQTLQDLMVDLEDSIAGMREERQLLERDRLLRTLQDTGGNITQTADILEKSRAAIYRLIEKHNIPLKRRA